VTKIQLPVDAEGFWPEARPSDLLLEEGR